jgi:tRNA threonylcarbamoyladenosine biosynthesis protein TsaB
LLPAVEQMLSRQGWQANSLTDVFVSIGPGSFTGLRIGVSIARTLAWSTGVRVQPVSTFDMLACNGLQADGVEHVAVVIDAKKAKAFLASFHLKDGWFEPGLSGRMGDVADFLAECEKPLAVLGEGIPRHQQAIDDAKVRVLPESQWHGRASNVIRVGLSAGSDSSSCPANELEPYYIRRPEPEEKWEQQHGRAPADGS